MTESDNGGFFPDLIRSGTNRKYYDDATISISTIDRMMAVCKSDNVLVICEFKCY